MKSNLLHIDTSPRSDRSLSRGLGADFIASWKAAHPDGTIQRIDLTASPVPLVSESWIEGAYAAPADRSPAAQAAIGVSDAYIDQLLGADQVLITTPIFNLTIPAALKAWIDQIVRVGRTFNRGPNGLLPLVKNRKVTVVVASGSDLRLSGPGAGYNFIEPYLRAILGFIGITDVTFVYGHSLNQPNTDREAVLASARHELQAIAAA